MPKRILLKAIRDTQKFKKGQKLWYHYGTGALAALVSCRWKGKGRWINTWAHWIDSDPEVKKGSSFSGRADCKWIGEVEITPEFERHLIKVSDPWERTLRP